MEQGNKRSMLEYLKKINNYEKVKAMRGRERKRGLNFNALRFIIALCDNRCKAFLPAGRQGFLLLFD
ncbi:MAG: hypothetical protein ABIP23_11770 [Pelobium sp.]